MNSIPRNNNITNQTELRLACTARTARRRPHPARAERAAWWFNRMREAVDSAVSCPTSNPGVAAKG